MTTTQAPKGKTYRKAFITVHAFTSIASATPQTAAEAKKLVAKSAPLGDALLIAVDAIRLVSAAEDKGRYLHYERSSGGDVISGKVPMPARSYT